MTGDVEQKVRRLAEFMYKLPFVLEERAIMTSFGNALGTSTSRSYKPKRILLQPTNES